MNIARDGEGAERVLTFKQRKTYLDACREQGIYSATLEMEAEIAALTAKTAATKREIARLEAELASNPPIALAERSADAAEFAGAMNRREAQIVQRFQTICRRYADAGCGDA